MASPRGTITGVHFALIFFVMVSIILGVVSYLKVTEATEAKEKAVNAQKEKSLADASYNKIVEELQSIKDEIGYNDSTDPHSDLPATVQKKLDKLVKEMAGVLDQGQIPTTVVASLQMLRVKLNGTLDTLKVNQNTLSTEKVARKAAEDNHAAAQKKNREQINTLAAEKNVLSDEFQAHRTKSATTISSLQQDLQQREIEKRQLDDKYKAIIKTKDQEISDTMASNRRLRSQIDALLKVSFEVEDGRVRWVDHVNGLVWINLGSSDFLPPRTTFSVYRKTHHGVGRGKEDIKGAIEVTRFLEPHLTECRILQNDLTQPIAKGDPIYTPLWTPGRKLTFAVAGIVHLDQDGQSDRMRLHSIVKATGAEIVHEVDEEGQRLFRGAPVTLKDGRVIRAQQIDVDTKFLVRGKIPDPSTAPTQILRDKLQAIVTHFAQMEKEAQLRGVRVVKLDDFLNWMGHTNVQRLWRPGSEYPRKLKAGAHSTSVNQTVGNRASSGRTSGVYTKRGSISQPKSSGQTSKLFRGGSGR